MKLAEKFYILLITAGLLFFYSSFYTNAESVISDACENPWFLEDISANDGWNFLTSAKIDFSKPVIVAVVDTGSDYSHPLITKALWVNTAEQNGIEGVDDDGNGYIDDIYGIDTCNQDSDPMDDSSGSIKGHGTHVAGLILQTAGVTIEKNPYNIRLMHLKAGNAYGDFDAADMAEAIRYAADNGASVINISISSIKAPSVLREALEYASKSAILVASTGNKGIPTSDSTYSAQNDYYPAGYPFVAGVMSYGIDSELSDFSNWDFKPYTGAEYEIAAPGEEICSCTYNSAYKTMDGTSMASGIVSGCAALLQAKYQNYELYTAKDLTAHLMECGTKVIPYTDLYGQSHTFRGINLYNLLSKEPKSKLVLGDVCLLENENSSHSFTLNYELLSRGCKVRGVSVEISSDMTGTLLKSLSPLPPELDALSQYEGRCSITVPKSLSKGDQVTLTLQISSENAPPLETSVKITIKDNDSKDSDIKSVIPLQGISFSSTSQLLMKPKSTQSLSVSYIPEDTTDDRTIIYSSSEPSVASVDKNGFVTAHKTGSSVLSATSSKGHVRTLTVTVYTLSEKTIPETGGDDKGHPVPDISNSPNTNARIFLGKTYTVNDMKYKVTAVGSRCMGTVTLTGSLKRKSLQKSLTIPNTVKIGGKRFLITAVEKDAFRNYTKLKSLRMERYIKILSSIKLLDGIN